MAIKRPEDVYTADDFWEDVYDDHLPKPKATLVCEPMGFDDEEDAKRYLQARFDDTMTRCINCERYWAVEHGDTMECPFCRVGATLAGPDCHMIKAKYKIGSR